MCAVDLRTVRKKELQAQAQAEYIKLYKRGLRIEVIMDKLSVKFKRQRRQMYEILGNVTELKKIADQESKKSMRKAG